LVEVWDPLDFVNESVQPTGTPDIDEDFLNDFQASVIAAQEEINLHDGRLDTAETTITSLDGRLDTIEAGYYNTAAEVLAALLTVDGPGSGLNADLLDGLSSADFAPIAHVGAGGTAHANAVAAGAAGFMTGADKTKLDGIETAATADMTAAELLTAIKTVDGSGSGLDADLLDGTNLADIQIRSEKNAASGYLGLDASSIALAQYLGTGTRNGTKFLRDDNTWQNVHLIRDWSFSGTLTTTTGLLRVPIHATGTIVSVRAMVTTAPTGSGVIIDLNKNGTTMYTTQANRPTIAASANSVNATLPDVTSLSAGDYLTVDIDSIGSTIAGANLVVSVRYSY